MPDPGEFDLVIDARLASRHYWRDLWNYRELLFFLAWRDVKVRYKQAALGVLWALVQPVVSMVLFTFVFGKLAGMPAGGAPYPLLVLAGLLPWQLFAGAFTGSSGSIVSNAHLVSKVYFPRLIVPLSALAVAVVDFGVMLVLYGALSSWFGVMPTWRIVFVPVFTALTLLVALGSGLWLTALTVKYRDFRFVVPFLLQAGIFATPVGYRADNLPNWKEVLALNPLTALIEGYRWCLLGGDFKFEPHLLASSMGITALLLASGVWYFRRTERTFADTI
jgi:lipopolysaccharide transport system permease protein